MSYSCNLHTCEIIISVYIFGYINIRILCYGIFYSIDNVESDIKMINKQVLFSLIHTI